MIFTDKIYIIIILMMLFLIREKYESYCDACLT